MAWGLFHGALLATYRLWTVKVQPVLAAADWLHEGVVGRVASGVGYAAGTVVTFAAVTLGWGLFVMPVDRFVTMLARLV